MSYVIVIPDPVKDKITSWALSIDIEEAFYDRLQHDLAEGHREKCMRLAAPSPTFVYEFDLQDPLIRGINHYFIVWLTYGPLNNGLYVRECDHKEEERWDP